MTGLSEECSGFFGIGRRYTAIAILVIDVNDDVPHQWSVVRPALLDWSIKRGPKRQGIELLFVTHEDRFGDVRSFLGEATIHDEELVRLFGEFPPLVSLMTTDGTIHDCFRLETPNL